MKARKKSILSNEEWKTIPWSYYKKTPKDLLLDVLVEMPRLMEESDILQSCDSPTQRDCCTEMLLNDCWHFDKQLREWLENHAPKQILRTPDTESPTLIDTTDLGSAHIMTLYWSVCIILYSIMRTVMGTETRLPERGDIKAYCRNIIRTIPIFFHPAVGTFRAHLATFPMGLVMRNLDLFEPEERAVEQRLLESCCRTQGGAAIGKFIKSLELDAIEQKKLSNIKGFVL